MSWIDYRDRIGRRRMLLTVESRRDLEAAKTATGVLCFRPEEVVAVVDSSCAGRSAAEVLRVPADVPIVGSVADALPLRPTELVIGVATPGGYLTGEIRTQVLDAIDAGLDIVNGLHALLRADPELRRRAEERGVRLFDLREPPIEVPLASDRARTLGVTRILTVGTDCNVGKMYTTLRITEELRRRGRRAEFAATGQTGILISGWGIAVDRVISDFVSGAAEWIVSQAAGAEFCLIEGQGALTHPAYSAVALGLLHGSAPDGMILCHRAGRVCHRHSEVAIPSLDRLVRLHEEMASAIHPSKVLAVAVNTAGLDPGERARWIETIAAETGLPVVDPGVDDVGVLADVVVRLRDGGTG